jgi:ribosomal protein L7Ae-like RNA K-turn-binding protein
VNERERIYSMIGLANAGRNLVSGFDGCRNAVYRKNARLLILAEDCAYNTTKFFTDKCRSKDIPLIVFGKSRQLGNITGKDKRVVVAVTDRGLAQAIQRLYDMLGKENLPGGDNCD